MTALDARGVFSTIWNQYLDCTTPLEFSVEKFGETFTCHALFKRAVKGFDFSCSIIIVNEKNFVKSIYLETIPENYIVNKQGPYVKNPLLKDFLVGFLKDAVLENIKEEQIYSKDTDFLSPHFFSGLSLEYILNKFAHYESFYHSSKGNMSEVLENKDLFGMFSQLVRPLYYKQGKTKSDYRKTYLPDDYSVQLVPDGRKTNVIMRSTDFFYQHKNGLYLKEDYRAFRNELNERILDVLRKLPVNWEAVALLNVARLISSPTTQLDSRLKYTFFTDAHYPNRMLFLKEFYGLVSALTYQEVIALQGFIDSDLLNINDMVRCINENKMFRVNVSSEQIMGTKPLNVFLLDRLNSKKFLDKAFTTDFYCSPYYSWKNDENFEENIESRIINLNSVLNSLDDINRHVPIELFSYMIANDINNGECFKSFKKYLEKITSILSEIEKPYFITNDLSIWMEENLPLKKWRNASQAQLSRFQALDDIISYFNYKKTFRETNMHVWESCPVPLSYEQKMEIGDWIISKYAYHNETIRKTTKTLKLVIKNLVRPLALFLANKESDAAFMDNDEYQNLLMTVAIKILINPYKIGDKTTFLEFAESLRHINVNKSKLTTTILCHTSQDTIDSILKLFTGFIDQRLIDGGVEAFLGFSEMCKLVNLLNPEKRVCKIRNENVRDINSELVRFNYTHQEAEKYNIVP